MNGLLLWWPIGQFIETFRNRVWIAGNPTYPDRLYFSSLPDLITSPTISWDTDVTTGDWIDISPQDGDNITGLKRSKNALWVFKRNQIYILDKKQINHIQVRQLL